MKYKITTVHGDDFHNRASFITNEHGYKAFLSMLKNDKHQNYPFRVQELESKKIVYQTEGWQESIEIHKEFGVKKMNLDCSFCCKPLPTIK